MQIWTLSVEYLLAKTLDSYALWSVILKLNYWLITRYLPSLLAPLPWVLLNGLLNLFWELTLMKLSPLLDLPSKNLEFLTWRILGWNSILLLSLLTPPLSPMNKPLNYFTLMELKAHLIALWLTLCKSTNNTSTTLKDYLSVLELYLVRMEWLTPNYLFSRTTF
jgi:hypothetical protein